MKGRSPVGKRCSCSVRFQAQVVLDGRSVAAVLAGVDEHVRADLREGRLEQDEVAVVGAAARTLAQQIHRVMKRVQAVFEPGQRGVELEWRGVWFEVAVGVRSQ